MARNAEPIREKANVFTRLSMLIGPMLAGDNPGKMMVEPPGIAPGSSPLIARAFISIVRPKPDMTYIGAKAGRSKALRFGKQTRQRYRPNLR